MATFYYQFKYDKGSNDFLGIVESVGGNVIYKIEDITEMRDLLSNKYMTHIDDTVGLEFYLKQKKLIEKYDDLLFIGIMT